MHEVIGYGSIIFAILAGMYFNSRGLEKLDREWIGGSTKSTGGCIGCSRSQPVLS